MLCCQIFLKVLKIIIDNSGDSPFQLSPDHEKAIQEGREKIKNGVFIEYYQVLVEAREWIKHYGLDLQGALREHLAGQEPLTIRLITKNL